MPIWLWITAGVLLLVAIGVLEVLVRRRGTRLGGDPRSGRTENVYKTDPDTMSRNPGNQQGPFLGGPF
ncbi:hypothetical protein [Amycolatopsis palatopharyngis]|uniref:hypothetical protein n=1 Tax=Amycolatopsis palatopharyngis TaxID=187982 RepID=UPI000E284A91|nr:hypothetical protein [Amycolatopsis palatopharyngis]